MFRTIQQKIGPGLLFAASAVGVSHLVQSTRGGAAYGLTMLAIIVIICLIKYPIFLFSARYTASTGETILDGYERLGRWILFLVFLVHLLELPFAIAGVSAVTTGIVKVATGIMLNDATVSILLVTGSIVLLALGRYPLLENISKIFVVMFLVCIVLAAVMSISDVHADSILLSGSLGFDRETVLFLVAIAGWMPTGVAGALGISLWIYEKNKRLDRRLNSQEVIFDFNLGYVIIILTACCFSILGSTVLYSSNVALEESSAAFSAQFIGIFISTLGQWAYYVILLGSFAVMFSSLLILVDLLPRISTVTMIRLFPDTFTKADQPRLYSYFIAYEMFSVMVVFLLLFESFVTFITLVTSIGFLAAPIIAHLNYKLIFSSHVPLDSQPTRTYRIWGLSSTICLFVTALLYLYLQI